jgi:hypothetical protein
MYSLATLSDHELLAETTPLAAAERHATAQLIALLAELDARELHLSEGYSSLFAYCTQALHLSESAAYDRISAARASRKFPIVLERLMTGAVTLTTVRLLGPHLTTDNCERCLDAASHKTKREVEQFVASLAPQPDVTSSVRRLPASKSVVAEAEPLFGVSSKPDEPPSPEICEARNASIAAAVPSRAIVKPLAPERYLIKVTVSGSAHEKLRRAQDLLRHAIPNGDPAVIVERALTVLVEQLERTRLAKVRSPKSTTTLATNSRRVPANIRRLVWQRDAGRCAFVGSQGRCAETAFLELHHVVPYAAGGVTSVEDLSLRCRAHNVHEAVQHFGATRSGTSSAEATSEQAARGPI